jgi:hypothetical protein
MGKYCDVIEELVYNKEIQNNINSLDDELKDIFERFKGMYDDKITHKWEDDSEIYGGFTFGDFKRIYMILLATVKAEKESRVFQTPLPCKIGDLVWEIYADDCGDGPCTSSCYECKYAQWKKNQVLFNTHFISEYNKSIFLTEEEADRQCDINKQLAEIRYRYKNPMKKGDEN